MKNHQTKQIEDYSNSLNIYLAPKHKKLLKVESEKRGLTLSAFLRSAALEKINREKMVEA